MVETNQKNLKPKKESKREGCKKKVTIIPKTDKTKNTKIERSNSLLGSITEKEKKNSSRLNRFGSGLKRSTTENQQPVNLEMIDERANSIDKLQKTKVEKMKSFFCFCTEKKNKANSRLKKSTKYEVKFNYEVKRAKKEIQTTVKSLRSYIELNWKWVIFLLFIYILVLGAIISTPIIANNLKVTIKNQTEQERSISYRL